MFRCIGNTEGLIIDIDSFEAENLTDFTNLFQKFKTIFLTGDNNRAERIREIFGKNAAFFIEDTDRHLIPDRVTHVQVIAILGTKTTSTAYISKNAGFLENALSFLSGTIWITDRLTYTDAGMAADLVCKDMQELEHVLLNYSFAGFLGEMAVYPDKSKKKGVTVSLDFEVDGRKYPLFMLGRYFRLNHYAHFIHPLSVSIVIGKIKGRNSYHAFDQVYYNLFKTVISYITRDHKIDGICAVPDMSGQNNWSEKISDELSRFFHIENLSESLKCERSNPLALDISVYEKMESPADTFVMERDVSGRNIVLISYVMTSGLSVESCVRELKRKGAEDIFIVALSVDQMDIPYWKPDTVLTKCRKCSNRMMLYYNRKFSRYYYRCSKCRSNTGFTAERKRIQKDADEETG